MVHAHRSSGDFLSTGIDRSKYYVTRGITQPGFIKSRAQGLGPEYARRLLNRIIPVGQDSPPIQSVGEIHQRLAV